jgi:hypothetical protein
MPASSPKRFKTLTEANAYFSKSQSPTGVKPVPPPPEKPPIFPALDQPPPKTQTAVLDLAGMPPATFEKFLSERTNAELKLLLSQETGKLSEKQNPAIIRRLYRELKKRGA